MAAARLVFYPPQVPRFSKGYVQVGRGKLVSVVSSSSLSIRPDLFEDNFFEQPCIGNINQ